MSYQYPIYLHFLLSSKEEGVSSSEVRVGKDKEERHCASVERDRNKMT